MNKILLSVIPFTFLMVGCAQFGTTESQQYAGISSAVIKPIMDDNKNVVATSIDIKLGKEYDAFNLKFKKTKDGEIDVDASASKVKAFDGQKLSAEQMAKMNDAINNLAKELGPSIIRKYLGL